MILKGHFELFTILYKLYVRFNYKSSKTFGTWAQMGTHSMKIDVYELKLAPHPLLINWGLLYSEAFLLKIHVSFFSLLRPFSANFFSERPFSEKFFYPQIAHSLWSIHDLRKWKVIFPLKNESCFVYKEKVYFQENKIASISILHSGYLYYVDGYKKWNRSSQTTVIDIKTTALNMQLNGIGLIHRNRS